MISARVKDFLINLLIAFVLAGILFSAIFYFSNLKLLFKKFIDGEGGFRISEPDSQMILFEQWGFREFNLFGEV